MAINSSIRSCLVERCNEFTQSVTEKLVNVYTNRFDRHRIGFGEKRVEVKEGLEDIRIKDLDIDIVYVNFTIE